MKKLNKLLDIKFYIRIKGIIVISLDTSVLGDCVALLRSNNTCSPLACEASKKAILLTLSVSKLCITQLKCNLPIWGRSLIFFTRAKIKVRVKVSS